MSLETVIIDECAILPPPCKPDLHALPPALCFHWESLTDEEKKILREESEYFMKAMLYGARHD